MENIFLADGTHLHLVNMMIYKNTKSFIRPTLKHNTHTHTHTKKHTQTHGRIINKTGHSASPRNVRLRGWIRRI